MVLNTATVSLAVTPTIVSTLVSHYLHYKTLRRLPTAHLSYDEGVHLIRSFLVHASHHTVEELQAFTSQWVPHPQWIRVEEAVVPDRQLQLAAALLQEQLGPDGIARVGGRLWWQWRRPHSPLRFEWVEMRSNYKEIKRAATGARATTILSPEGPGGSGISGENAGSTTGPATGLSPPHRRVMMYIHGGAYFFGSVDEHRYQMQRHARKLRARVFAPSYRLAPQFPFPCGLHDCLAAYLHLLDFQGGDAATIVLAGDSAGGGMVLSLLVLLRDRHLPLPAGAVLISPWVDLTHSFPSVGIDCPLDYIPPYGFQHRPSMAWPPPTEDELCEMERERVRARGPGPNLGSGPASASAPPPDANIQHNRLCLTVDGKEIVIKEQIQMYTTNDMLAHPLVSPVLQPTLGGLPPLLVMVGGGELLRDEQIYLAHKCANPTKYAPPLSEHLDEPTRAAMVATYKPTNVQLQVWDDLCHVAPTLSFTRPAKYMYRAIAQFGNWALARAQQGGTEILVEDDQISATCTSSSDEDDGDGRDDMDNGDHSDNRGYQGNRDVHEGHSSSTSKDKNLNETPEMRIGKAGDPLPPFRSHMIRQRVTVHGDVFALAPADELPGCTMAAELVGVPKQVPIEKWLQAKQQWNARFATEHSKVHKRRMRDAAAGFESCGPDERPPPSALAGRCRIGVEAEATMSAKAVASMTKKTKKRSLGLAMWSLWGSKHDEAVLLRRQEAEGAAKAKESAEAPAPQASETKMTQDASAEEAGDTDRRVALAAAAEEDTATPRPSLPLCVPDNDTGVTGKRIFLGGIAMPFSLHKDAETASMVTLNSDNASGSTTVPSP